MCIQGVCRKAQSRPIDLFQIHDSDWIDLTLALRERDGVRD